VSGEAVAAVAGRGRFCAGRFYQPAEPRGELISRSPAFADEVIGSFAFGKEDVSEAVVAAARAARPWGQEELATRLKVVAALRSELVRAAPELTASLVRESGRPPWECQREVQGLLARIDLLTGSAAELLADRSYGDLPARVRSLPLGVVAVIGPAMLPLSTSHTHIIAALLAGNSVVFKPSPLGPATAQRYFEAIQRAGLPAGVCNLVQGDDAVGFELANHAQVDAVVFTGRSEHGAQLRRALADRWGSRLILHMGGKNPAVVLEDADLPVAAYEVLTSAMLTSGQRCTATSRVLVHQAVLGEFCQRIVALAGALRVGPPAHDVFMGPLLSAARLDRFLAQCQVARSEGAEPLRHGGRDERPELRGHFASPSIHLVHQRRADSVYQHDELFGPDLAIYPVADIDDALELCDSGPYGLCAALFTESPLRWRRFAEEVRAGSLFWNRGTSSPSGRMPFGGVKRSGYGGRGGADAILALRREVSLLGRTSDSIERWPGTEITTTADPPKIESEVPT
jgi:succinylglutamic semialdehyde dehydrogenase